MHRFYDIREKNPVPTDDYNVFQISELALRHKKRKDVYFETAGCWCSRAREALLRVHYPRMSGEFRGKRVLLKLPRLGSGEEDLLNQIRSKYFGPLTSYAISFDIGI